MQDKFDALLTIEAIKLSCIVENKIDLEQISIVL